MSHHLADMGITGHLLGDELELTKWYVNRGYNAFWRRRGMEPPRVDYNERNGDSEVVAARLRAAAQRRAEYEQSDKG
jgi:hypothetical protein